MTEMKMNFHSFPVQLSVALTLLLVCIGLTVNAADLSSEEKQIFLDLHNYYRAATDAADMRQLEWSAQLQEDAKKFAEECDAVDLKRGQNIFYNITTLQEDTVERLDDIVRLWKVDSQSLQSNMYTRQPLLWSMTSSVGCARFHCPTLSLRGGRVQFSDFYVCQYSPEFFNGRELFKEGECDSEACKLLDVSLDCVEHVGVTELNDVITQSRSMKYCAASSTPPMVPDEEVIITPPVDRVVWYFTPRSGSIAGGTMITIVGRGFSSNQFEGRNIVTLGSGNAQLECQVIAYYSSSSKIVCVTPPSPVRGDDSLELRVRVSVGSNIEDVTCNNCIFNYNVGYWTPFLKRIEPLASTFEETVTMAGDLFAAGFDDPDSPEEDGQDFYTRILIGGRVCSNFNENGTKYNSSLEEDGRYAQVTCRPTVRTIESLNATVVLQKRGRSEVRHVDQIIALDNKFQPYNFQTHADILYVTPSGGSTDGGTKITITVNTPLANYTNNIKVFVGGVPCMEVTVLDEYDEEDMGVIECVTGPQPPSAAIYPGSRGILREFFPGFQGIGTLLNLAPTNKTAVHERMYLSTYLTPADFGEEVNFGHRFTGFFVPPISSLYTFNVRSDDHSRLYLSQDGGAVQEIARANRHTSFRWDRFTSQFSDPIFLEGGKYYYFVVVANQAGGPYDVGVGVKVHNLSFTDYPYEGDYEEQRTTITSTTVKERHAIHLGARPAVNKITLSSLPEINDNQVIQCYLSLVVASQESSINTTLTFSLLAEAGEVEQLLNGVESIQSVGRVEVLKKYGDDDSTELYIVFLTPYGFVHSDIPELSLASESFDCIHSDFDIDTNTTNTTYFTLTASIETTQNLTYPNGFKLGFEQRVQDPRFTPFLPLSTTAEQLTEELTTLFAWQCTNQLTEQSPMDQQSFALLHRSYEEDNGESGRDDTTSFCGHYSLENPRTVWDTSVDNGIKVDQYRYICFAYKGSFLPNLRIRSDFRIVNDDNEITFDGTKDFILNGCPGWPFSSSDQANSDGWFKHDCIDLSACLESFEEQAPRGHVITRVWFDYRNDFWIDELMVVVGQFDVLQQAAPARPNNVLVSYIEVTGEHLEMPTLQFNNRSDSSDEPDITMVTTIFEVTYTVRDCGTGMGLLSGYLDVEGDPEETPMVFVEQVEEASGSVGGMFMLSYGGQTVSIPADATAVQLRSIIQAEFWDEDEQGVCSPLLFSVTRGGSCSGYRWDVEWTNKQGDIALMGVSGEYLTGPESQITVETRTDGGTWVRPLRGDMLRLPEVEPQIEVIINDIPSSCRGKACSFNFTDSLTPHVYSISPTEGQGGTIITIYGSGFTDYENNVTVTIGNSACSVTNANETHIECMTSDHTAGFYNITVHIAGMGTAQVEENVCFNHLLVVSSVTPSTGGVGGGHMLQITGNGFLPFDNYNSNNFYEPISWLPWFRHGFGLPKIDDLTLCSYYERSNESLRMHLLEEYNVSAINYLIEKFDEPDFFFDEFCQSCDNVSLSQQANTSFDGQMDGFSCVVCNDSRPPVEELTSDGRFNIEVLLSYLFYLYGFFPSSVRIDGVPCVITEATLTTIECIPAISLPNRSNLSVQVWGEEVTLVDEYEISINSTVMITSVQPRLGPVTGNTLLIIEGVNFGTTSSSQVSVQIGSSECEVYNVSDTQILCTTTQHEPGRDSILVSTPNGVGVSYMALEEALDRRESESDSGTGNDLPPFPVFHYQLQVQLDSDNLNQPLPGSSFGGTVVTLRGGIFIQGDTEILVGGTPAEILSISTNEVQFITPSSSRTYYSRLKRSQFSAASLLELYWNEDNFQIQVGDSITWTWELDCLPSLTPLELELFQTFDSQSNSPHEDGFSSNEGTTTFTYTFTKEGVYYFATQTNYLGTLLRGVVNVSQPIESRFDEIEVYVGGYKAEVVVQDGDQSGSSASGSSVDPQNISRRKRQSMQMNSENMCEVVPPMGARSDGPQLLVNYSPCYTPTVDYVTPQTGTISQTVYTIYGSQFSTTKEDNIITFGGYTCVVQSSTETEINCTLYRGPEDFPPPFSPLPVELTVTGLGSAYVPAPDSALIMLTPAVYEISPSQGSVEGGTDIILSGEILSHEYLPPASVTIGQYACEITNTSYTQIECTTQAVDSGGEYVFMVEFGDQPITADCGIEDGCIYAYSEDHTPIVSSVNPTSVSGTVSARIELCGSGFDSTPEYNMVYVGEYQCETIEANETCIVCELDPLPAGSYDVRMKVCNLTDDRCYGNARIENEARTITSMAVLTGVDPPMGSIRGGTEITISGLGFPNDPSIVSVAIGETGCAISSVSYDSLTCMTSSNTAGNYDIDVSTAGGITFSGAVEYSFSMDATPVVSSINPPNGQLGETIQLLGSNLLGDVDESSVRIGGADCSISRSESNDSMLMCTADGNIGGEYAVILDVGGIGRGITDDIMFTYDIIVNNISPTEGSIAGGSPLIVSGIGNHPSFTTVTICDKLCVPTGNIASLTQFECLIPEPDTEITDNLQCPVILETLGQMFPIEGGYTYRLDLTPFVDSINKTRGGTEGGTPLLITGSGFTDIPNVTIADAVCEVSEYTSETIVCVTERSGRTVRAPVVVMIPGKGKAVSTVTFWYVDVWSSPFTWGGGPLPAEGDFVVVPTGQTLLLDTVTPILSYLLIQGGQLIFDQDKGDNEVELHTQGALITSGGVLQVGTEDEPFLSKTQIVLYGHVLSTEIPVYGAKTLALRKGVIDMHGRPLNVTWTKLLHTAAAGDNELYLREYVDWDVGGKIVIASTSFSQEENEELTIASIDAGSEGSILTLEETLEYEHISVQQTIAGRFIDTSAEVGYLTRNVVVRGNVNEEWVEQVDECPEDFRPGQFEVQSCFLGRFGPETISDQFGSQIMIHAEQQNQGDVIGRFEYIEVTHAGQAFRLGRYPIHFHLNGNVSGSYVRGCGIHHTFNRAVTVHAVDYLLIEKNVAYNILGHAYFLEDGIEEHNIIQDNLGIFVRASSSLLNVDITPATFWVVNPNNIVRRNAAAGGTHFGFWYRLPQNPTGPSFTTTVCPRSLPVEEFADNTAHSFGWYGLWVFREYYPTVSGTCGDTRPAPVYYDRFFAWHNDRGVEFSEVGALQLRDSIMLDNKIAGVEYTVIDADWNEENGSVVKDTLIVGYSAITSDACSESGIKTPHSNYLIVSNVTFANFDRDGCFPVQACSHCRLFQGGFESRFKQITYINAGNDITKWQWMHEHIQRDLDGSLTREDGSRLLIPTTGILPPEDCKHHPASSFASGTNGTNGSICHGDLQFGRVAIFDPEPSSLEFTNITISNDYGEVDLMYVLKRLRAGPGYMTQLLLNSSYQLTWVEGQTFTNISYNYHLESFTDSDYIIWRQMYPRTLDLTVIGASTDAVNESQLLNNPAAANSGDWFIGDNNTLTYIVKGPAPPNIEKRVSFQTYRCFYDDCIAPPPPTVPPPIPPGRPEEVYYWSDESIWPNNMRPQFGENVTINSSLYVIIDEPIPRLSILTINGGVELLDSMNHVIEADLIIIDGGRLVAGYPDTPFRNKVNIILYGTQLSPEFPFDKSFGSPTVGAKAIGVFGELVLNSIPLSRTWTMLASTAETGQTRIELQENVDWEAGQSIVITSTSYDGFESEVHEISSIMGRTITLTKPLNFTHLAVSDSYPQNGPSYSIRAEVGLLTRNIVIENGNSSLADGEAFGCRVLVSSNLAYSGLAQLSGVEFKGCGQLGYTDDFDPRYALAFLRIGRPLSFIPNSNSYVTSCSFHDGYNTAIGIFASDEIQVHDNVIHNTVGPSMVVSGRDNSVQYNLASLAQFLGTYRDRYEPSNSDWTANFEVTEASSLTLIGNSAAGGAKSGFHTNGEECSPDSTHIVRNNIAHSTLHGIHLGYTDGQDSGCTRLSDFVIYNCYHYGIFSYSPAAIHINNSILINNKAGVYVSVIGPPALSHELGTKTVDIENTIIVSRSKDFSCDDDSKHPDIADHPTSHSGLVSPTGGHVGIVIPSFVSGRGHFPKAAWFTIISYPAISGLTRIHNVLFVNFAEVQCRNTDKDVVIMTNRASEDANHPIYLDQISFIPEIASELKVFVQNPNLGSVNPSDCVDMDCDGFKKVLLKDLDGSFSEESGQRTIISRAEFEWDGDPRRGLGDYRIPRTVLTRPNGSRINVDSTYPSKGIVRGNGFLPESQHDCMFIEAWNMYHCSNLDHLMLVMESLDPDTEVRRLSPISLAANGFVDLINGPQDHGWCGGYTCQERISTFYSIVAAGLHYTVALTSTNPQDFSFHLLNSDPNQCIVVGIVYTNPQRLDVYMVQGNEDVYVPPNNAMLVNGNLEYMSGNPDQGEEQFIPTVNQIAGSNFYSRSTKQLYIAIKGSTPYKIITKPVIMLSLDISVSVMDFFNDTFLVRNLALLLDIPQDRIRIVNVVREGSIQRRRRQAEEVEMQTIEIEIGDPPVLSVSTTVETPVNGTDSMNDTGSDMNDTMTGGTVSTDTPFTFNQITSIAERVAEVIQTGELVESFNSSATIVSANIEEPVPPPMDPTGGVRATPDTGGPQPEEFGENDTTPMTFYETQLIEEEQAANESDVITLSIPTRLSIMREAGAGLGIVDGVVPPQLSIPVIAMLDNNGAEVTELGLEIPWVLTAAIVTGPDEGFLIEPAANFTQGRAEFSTLIFSHPGDYVLSFTVTYPPSADFSILQSTMVTVEPRQLGLQVSQQPPDGNTSFVLFPYPRVQLIDLDYNRAVITDHSWRNSSWYISAQVQRYDSSTTVSSTRAPLVNGEAIFMDILVEIPGTYKIAFSAYTEPATVHLPGTTSSEQFTIEELPSTSVDVIYDVDFTSTIGGNEEDFIAEFREQFERDYPEVEIVRIELSEGSIIVTVFVTASVPQQLVMFVDQIADLDTLSFTFNGTMLMPSNVTLSAIFIPTPLPQAVEDELVLILATTIPAGTILLVTLLLIVIVLLCYRHQRRSKSVTIKVKPAPTSTEQRYIDYNLGRAKVDDNTSLAASSVDEYFLIPENQDIETRSFESHELDSLASTPASQRKTDFVVSQKVKVPAVSGGAFFTNPVAIEMETNVAGQLTDETMNDLWMNKNGNNNNNNHNDFIIDPSSSMSANFHPHILPTPEETAALLNRSPSPRPSTTSSFNSTTALIKSPRQPSLSASGKSSRVSSTTSRRTAHDRGSLMSDHHVFGGQDVENGRSSVLSRVEDDVMVEDIED